MRSGDDGGDDGQVRGVVVVPANMQGFQMILDSKSLR